jgi:hypothetical protein
MPVQPVNNVTKRPKELMILMSRSMAGIPLSHPMILILLKWVKLWRPMSPLRCNLAFSICLFIYVMPFWTGKRIKLDQEVKLGPSFCTLYNSYTQSIEIVSTLPFITKAEWFFWVDDGVTYWARQIDRINGSIHSFKDISIPAPTCQINLSRRSHSFPPAS